MCVCFIIKISENRNDSFAGFLDKKTCPCKSGFTFSRRVSSLGEKSKKNKEDEGEVGKVSSRRFRFLPAPPHAPNVLSSFAQCPRVFSALLPFV